MIENNFVGGGEIPQVYMAVKQYFVTKGGPGSGYFGHAGRPGKRGGSAPSNGANSTYNFDIKPSTMRILEDIRNSGGRPLIVGGYVRDLAMGKDPKDLDIEVYGLSSSELQSVLSRHAKVNLVGESFGIIKVDMRKTGGDELDFSLPRRENKSGRGHRGFIVEPDENMTPEEAASRRDFTMNAMFLDPFTGKIYDPFGGMNDIKNGVLRHTGEAFAEDPLRVLRGVQFCSRFNMTLAPETAELCRSLIGEYNDLPKERVWGEWEKWATKGQYPSKGLEALVDSGWINLYPELRDMIGVPQMEKYHPEGDVWEHTKCTVDVARKIAEREKLSAEDRTTLIMTMLLHDTGKPQTTVIRGDEINSPGHPEAGVPLAKSFMDGIGVFPTISEKVIPLVKNHLRVISGPLTPRSVRRMADAISPSSIKMMSLVIEADERGRPPSKLWNHMKPTVKKMLDIASQTRTSDSPMKAILSGQHLIDNRIIAPGPAMGNLLRKAREAEIDGEFDTLEGAIEWARKHANG